MDRLKKEYLKDLQKDFTVTRYLFFSVRFPMGNDWCSDLSVVLPCQICLVFKYKFSNCSALGGESFL